MSTFGIIVEGLYDEAVYPELIRRITSPDADVLVRICGGKGQLMKQFPALLKDLQRARFGDPVDKALVIRDWRGPNPRDAEQLMAQRIQRQRFLFPRGVQLCAVRHEMETWLLADTVAINSVASQRGGRTVPRISQDLEQIGNPKEMLRRLLLDAKLPYDARVCAEIAREARLDILRNRCPSFRSFEIKVTDC